MKLKDKVVIITGGSRGIGRASAIAFAQEGAKVVIASRILDTAEEVVNTIKNNGGEVLSIKLDISDPKQVQDMVSIVIAHYGKIDILVNNAGITDDAFIVKMTYEQWDNVINTNLSGTFYCIKEVIPYMIDRHYGRIINVSSIAGEKGAVAQVNYAASKAGIIGLTLSLAQELGSKGITVNAVSPGYISTNMVDKVPEKIKQRAITKIPVGRIGNAEEIANAFVFLASDEASYCNGTILDVNGGISL